MRKLVLVCVSSIAFLALTACSDNKSEGTTPPATTETQPAQPPATAPAEPAKPAEPAQQ